MRKTVAASERVKELISLYTILPCCKNAGEHIVYGSGEDPFPISIYWSQVLAAWRSNAEQLSLLSLSCFNCNKPCAA